MFNGKRLSLARRRLGLNKKAFAEALKIHPRTINRYEEGERVPAEGEVARIASVTGFPEPFFFGEEFDEASADSASFRSLTSMTAAERESALAAGSIGFMFSDWIEDRFALPDHDLEDLSRETPEIAARTLRELWQIGERPVSNMLHLLESKGVRTFSLAEDTSNLDAFSLWRRNKPYAFLNRRKSAERQRFDAAHELGHLVLHRHGGPQGRRAEIEADRFASAFLMPAADVIATIPRVLRLADLVEAKARWRVSVAALNRRCHSLKLTTDWEYRSFCIQIQERGYRTIEPAPVEPDASAVWPQVFRALLEDRVTKTEIASQLSLPAKEIESLVFGLGSMMSIDGAGGRALRSKADLKLVS
jgi:Zn-dependent peptidase ImmA (M78 family)/DNA-binding XRE family transcriptional regulator